MKTGNRKNGNIVNSIVNNNNNVENYGLFIMANSI
jgi:hypothetical protein